MLSLLSSSLLVVVVLVLLVVLLYDNNWNYSLLYLVLSSSYHHLEHHTYIITATTTTPAISLVYNHYQRNIYSYTFQPPFARKIFLHFWPPILFLSTLISHISLIYCILLPTLCCTSIFLWKYVFPFTDQGHEKRLFDIFQKREWNLIERIQVNLAVIFRRLFWKSRKKIEI